MIAQEEMLRRVLRPAVSISIDLVTLHYTIRVQSGDQKPHVNDRKVGRGTVFTGGSAITNYQLYKAFPNSIDPACPVRCLDYLFGLNPGSNVSFVSDGGVRSEKTA